MRKIVGYYSLPRNVYSTDHIGFLNPAGIFGHLDLHAKDFTNLPVKFLHEEKIVYFLKNNYNLPESFFELYRKENKVVTNLEIIFEPTLIGMSLQQIYARILAINKGSVPFCDLAFSSFGMGWALVVSWDREKQRLFVRVDGGSSDWDREANFKYYHESDKFSMKNIKDKNTISLDDCTNMENALLCLQISEKVAIRPV
jgi:hypothetical protein